MNSQTQDPCFSGDPEQHVGPAWLRVADVEALIQRFAPLDAAQVRRVALAIDQGTPPVEVLILRLVGARLSPRAARQLIVDLRLLRQRRQLEQAPSPTAGSEFLAALHAAATSYVRHPGNPELAATAIVERVGWSLQRARWFLSVNQDRVRQLAEQLRAEPPADN